MQSLHCMFLFVPALGIQRSDFPTELPQAWLRKQDWIKRAWDWGEREWGKPKETNPNQTKPRGLSPGEHERRSPKHPLTRGLTYLACLLGPGGVWGPIRIGVI